MNRALNVVPVRRQLTNGLSVHIFPESQFHHTFMSCTVPYGSIHDSGLPGRAHFLEHMMFANPDQQPVKPIFHALGASTSALTRYDVTTYQLACTGELEKSIDLFMHMLASPYFTPMHIEEERAAILQELSMFADQPSWQSLQQLTRMMYGEQHPIALDVAGTQDSVHLVTPDVLYEAYNTHYVTSQMSVTVIGPVDTENIIDILEQFPARGKYMADDKYASKFNPAKASEPKKQRYVELEMDSPLPLIRLGFRADTGMSLTEQVACMIGLEALLGDTSDFQTNGLKSGFLHPGGTWDHYYRKEFAFSSMCSYSSDPVALYNELENICEDIQTRTFTAVHMESARMRWLSKYYTSWDSLKQRCMNISEHDVIGLDYTDLGTVACGLTEEDILSAVTKIATSARLHMVVIR